MTAELSEPCCPDCDGTDFVLSYLEVAKVTMAVDFYVHDDGSVDAIEREEDDREIVDAERDDALLTCRDCGAQFVDTDELTPDQEA